MKQIDTLYLIVTKNFGTYPCSFYQNNAGDIFLIREQIGIALEYANPTEGILKIHKKHKDKLSQYSTCVTINSNTGNNYNTVLYTFRGVMELCIWCGKSKAKAFMIWCWDVIVQSNLSIASSKFNEHHEVIANIDDKCMIRQEHRTQHRYS